MRHTKRSVSYLEFASMLLDVSAAARLELLEAYAELEGVSKSVSGVLDKVCEDCGEAAFRAGGDDADAGEEAEAPS